MAEQVTTRWPKREPVYWGAPGAEQLSGQNEDDAVEDILEEIYPDPLPEVVEIAGFVPMDAAWAIDRIAILERCLEELDEEYGNPDGEPAKPTEAMVAAERAFLEVLKREYTPWACEEVCRKEVNVAAWVRENRPDWIEAKEPTP